VPYCAALSELRRGDEPRFGAKSANLGELLLAGIPVPAGFALSAEAYRSFVAQSGLRDGIEGAIAGLTESDVDRGQAVSRAIGASMRSAPVPELLSSEIAERYLQLAQACGVASPPVAVRSSAVGEDSQDATFAGQQESYLWVRGAEHVCDAVRDCWVSLYSPPAISYRARLARRRHAPAMGVTVQLMVDAERSGVMFTCNPVSGDPSMVAINASWGLGLAVVGGEVTPDYYLVSKVTRELVREQVSSKQVEYVPDPLGRGAVRVQVPPARRDARCLTDDDLVALVDVADAIEGYFASHQDIEFVLARDACPADRLFIVQSRPVTAVPPQRKPEPQDAISMVMGTFGAPQTTTTLHPRRSDHRL
jgi:pyruvate,water dikinase